MFGGFSLDVWERGVPQQRPPRDCPESERVRPLLLSENRFCVRTVSDTGETPVKHRDLREHADAHRCGKSLMESALVRGNVHQHAVGK